MTRTKLQMANRSLGLLGCKAILDFTTTEEARKADALWASSLEEALSEAVWRFATKKRLLAAPSNVLTIDSITVSGTLVTVVTTAAHGMVTGDAVAISDTTEYDTTESVTIVVTDTDTFTFDLDETETLAEEEAGTVTQDFTPAWTENASMIYVYEMPSDYVKLSKYSATGKTRVNGNLIISDMADLGMEYVYFEENPTTWSAEFVVAFCDLYAANLAFAILNSATKSEELRAKYEKITLPKALNTNSTQDSPQEESVDYMDAARYMGAEQGE